MTQEELAKAGYEAFRKAQQSRFKGNVQWDKLNKIRKQAWMEVAGAIVGQICRDTVLRDAVTLAKCFKINPDAEA